MKFQTSYKQLTKYNQFNQSTLLKVHLKHFCNGKTIVKNFHEHMVRPFSKVVNVMNKNKMLN